METAKKAIVQVGHGGRGFIVGARDRFVVTAAHCVPIEHIPTPDMSNGPEQLTFPNIIGPLGETPTIWCELCAYGLTDDIAAFCEPEVDDQDQYVKVHRCCSLCGWQPARYRQQNICLRSFA